MSAVDAGAARGSSVLPSGTVTFVFTDIEGSTRMAAQLGAAYEELLNEHRLRIRAAVAAAGGHEVSTEGDALFLAFDSASAAVAATVQAQRALATQDWPGGTGIPVRIGVHTGEATLAGDDYVGLEVHRAARIASAAHGGQVLLSAATRGLVEDRLPPGVTLRDLGEHRLKDLSRAERLAQLVIEGLRSDFPPPRTLDATPNNLPVQLTSFVGREQILPEARRLLGRTRLLTLTGPGGTGKTRLALEVAADVADEYPDGVYFVALAALSDPALVAPSIAAAAAIPQTGSRPPLEQLIEGLRGRRTLLVLDNFEQLLPAAPAIGELLRGTDGLRVIVTSRAVLRISGEQELPVPPLGLPDARAVHGAASLSQYDAVRLFIERAVAARPDFAVTNENAPAVAEITARLDGLPLAIELAAARLRLLSPQAILARLGDRLALLSGGARDLPARQQTLRAAIAWSYDLLDAPDRELFGRLGVFMGGWTLEAVEAVAAAGAAVAFDVFEGLGSLSEKSLVRPVEDQHGDARFMMLQTIHAFAQELLADRPDRDDLRRAHAAWFLELAEGAAVQLGTGDRRLALERLEDDNDNLRAAIDWLAIDDVDAASRLAVAMWRFWQMRGYLVEGRTRVDRLLADDDQRHVLGAASRRTLLSAAGGIAYWQADMTASHEFYREAVDLARAHGTRRELADALYDLAFAPIRTSDVGEWSRAIADQSRPMLDEAIAIFTELGDRDGLARCLWARSEREFFARDIAHAEQDLLDALAIFRERGDRFYIAWSLHMLGMAHMLLDQTARSRDEVRAAFRMFVEDGDLTGISLGLVDSAALELMNGNADRALRIAAAADALARRIGTGLADVAAQPSYFPPLPQKPDDPARQAVWDEGAAMPLEQAIAYALNELGESATSREPAVGGQR